MHKLIQDSKYPEMYRVEWSDGEISDMVNKTRAKDAIRRWREYGRATRFRKQNNGVLNDHAFV